MIFKYNQAICPSSSTRQLHAHLADFLESCLSIQSLKKIHAQSLLSGLRPDLFFNNLLLKAYSQCNLSQPAHQLFDRMSHRNIISWSTMISMYTHHDQPEEALSLFSLFRRSSTLSESSNEFILASVLRACCLSKATLGCALQVHGFSIKTAFSSDLYVGTALINFYSRIGSMEESMFLFDELPVKSSVTWTSIMSGFCQTGNHKLSLWMFNQMKMTGVQPDRFLLSTLINACTSMQFLEGGWQVHGYVYRHGITMDVSINNVLVDLYCKSSKLQTAKNVFDRIAAKNLVSWTTLIAGYMQNSFDLEALDLFMEMNRFGWSPDAFACSSILSSISSLMALQHGKQVHAFTIKANLWLDEYVHNALIDMYAKCNSLAHAKLLFYAKNGQGVVSYNAMIEGHARHEEIVDAFALFNRMRSFSLRPTILTFVSLISVSVSFLKVDTSKQVHCLIIKFGVTLEPFVGSALVDVYSKCSCITDARKVFDEICDRDLVMWNAMLFGYVQNGQGEEALKLFYQLCIAGMRPNEFTLVAAISMASFFASLLHGLQFHARIIKADLGFDFHVSNALIDMYAKCGNIEDAWKLFEETNEMDIACWNSMISRCAQHGHTKEALQIFCSMIKNEVVPNYVTFVGVLTACCHAGLVEDALFHFCLMKQDFGIEPGMEHYASIVNLLGRAGRLQEAKDFIEKMPIKPPAAVWRSLLSSCRVYGNVELGRDAARMAMLLDSTDSGSHVLMSNIFASKSMWGEVEKVRERMDQIGTAKEPGYSWIELKKEVHVFIAKGGEHREAGQIYLMLDCLTLMLKFFGYEPLNDELVSCR